jgi:hypothetical protein
MTAVHRLSLDEARRLAVGAQRLENDPTAAIAPRGPGSASRGGHDARLTTTDLRSV